MIYATQISHTGGSIAPSAPPERPAGANGLSAAPGSPPRASKAASSRFFKLPSISTSRVWTLLFGRPNTKTRAQSHQRGEGLPGAGGGTPDATKAAALSSSQNAQPQTFGALYGDNGSLRRDVVTALMERLEQRIPGLSDMPGGAQAGAAKPNAADRPVDVTMTDPELRGMTEKLMRAEAMLGKQDSVELRAVKALLNQVIGARASLGKPYMLDAATKKSAEFAREGTVNVFAIGGVKPVPHFPFPTIVSPMIGGAYSNAVSVSDDLSVSETRSVEANLGVVGHINAFFAKLDLGITGKVGRSRGRGYADHEHLVRAEGSSVNTTKVKVPELEDLARVVSSGVLPKSLSPKELGMLSDDAYGKYDEFAKTAAMLGVIVQQPRADSAHHPLGESYKNKVGAGARIQTDTAGVKLHGSATLGLSATGLMSNAGVHGSASVEGSKASTGIRAYIPLWKALDSGTENQAVKDITQKRLGNLREALSPMVQSLQKYHGQPARAGTAFPQVLDAIAKWQPGQPPVDAAALSHTLKALTTELDLYCHAKRLESSDSRSNEVCRSIEQAWGIKPKEGTYGYLRALAVTTALIDQHARDTQTSPLDGYQDLTSRLASPAMPHDGESLQRATGFKDTQRTHTYQMEATLGANASIQLPYVGAGIDANGKIKGARVEHFNVLKAGDFIDVEIGLGVSANASLAKLADPLTKWVNKHLAGAIGPAADSGIPAALLGALSSAATGLESLALSVDGKAHVVVALRLSKPLSASDSADGAAESVTDKANGSPGFNLENVRVMTRRDFLLNGKVRQLGMVMGKNAIRSVMSNLDGIYAKAGGPAVRDEDARASLDRSSLQRDLPAMFESLASDGSAATRQVHAFVREALKEVNGEAAQGLQNCESNFFDAMRAYAAVAASQTRNAAAAGTGQEETSAVSAGSSMPSGDAALKAGLRASPEYEAAKNALLDLTKALRGPNATRRDRATEYAATLGKVPANP
ncbi:hypothetical protein [Bordetella sp. LUAb4]|uniref:hypothetical protein n=1 Tax=Bordetella sp. LUAb4 TaxID=2843195 RepID=UPI001E550CD7|nr:hypothetical protein [Bordetella sp. LUAb4]